MIGSAGVVGQAQVRMLSPLASVIQYDIADGRAYPKDEIAACDFAVIAVGTPAARTGRADLGALRASLQQLPRGVPALIRSTVPPGLTDLVNRSGRLAAHWPEFLHERPGGRWRESADVPFAVLGGPAEALKFFAPKIRAIRGEAGPLYQCPAPEAEMAKYVANLHWATRVTFVNEMAGICAALGADWDTVREIWTMDTRVSAAYTRMAPGFGAGFGGACWPKDLAALIAAASDAGYEPEFLDAVSEANARFRGHE